MLNLTQADKLVWARNAFKEFWSVARSEFPENMVMSFEEFYGYMAQRGTESLADFGYTCALTADGWGSDASDVWNSMQAYARKTQGQVAQYADGYPKMSDFYDALIGKMNEWNVSRIGAAFGNTAKESFQEATAIAGTALGGYLGITAAVSLVGLFIVIISFKKK